MQRVKTCCRTMQKYQRTISFKTRYVGVVVAVVVVDARKAAHDSTFPTSLRRECRDPGVSISRCPKLVFRVVHSAKAHRHVLCFRQSCEFITPVQ